MFGQCVDLIGKKGPGSCLLFFFFFYFTVRRYPWGKHLAYNGVNEVIRPREHLYWFTLGGGEGDAKEREDDGGGRKDEKKEEAAAGEAERSCSLPGRFGTYCLNSYQYGLVRITQILVIARISSRINKCIPT